MIIVPLVLLDAALAPPMKAAASIARMRVKINILLIDEVFFCVCLGLVDFMPSLRFDIGR